MHSNTPIHHSTTRQSLFFFFFNDTATTEIYTLSLHDALPIPLAAVHNRLLQRREAAAAHDHDDDVVEHVGLGLHRPPPIMLAQDADDARRDRRQQVSTG